MKENTRRLLKLLELQTERDYYIAAFICMFLVLTNFLYTQNILSAVYMLVSVVLITTAMISMNDKNHKTEVQDRARLALNTEMFQPPRQENQLALF